VWLEHEDAEGEVGLMMSKKHKLDRPCNTTQRRANDRESWKALTRLPFT